MQDAIPPLRNSGQKKSEKEGQRESLLGDGVADSEGTVLMNSAIPTTHV